MTAAPLGFCTIGQLEDDVRIAQDFKPLATEEMRVLRERGGPGVLEDPRLTREPGQASFAFNIV
jgi:hypothetical protein